MKIELLKIGVIFFFNVLTAVHDHLFAYFFEVLATFSVCVLSLRFFFLW